MKLRKSVGGVVAALVAMAGFIPAAAPSLAAPTGASVPVPSTVDIGQCVPPNGVGTVDPAGVAKPNPADSNVNVYVGGNFTRAAGAEAEGQMVIDKDADFGEGLYNSGWVGVGSGLMPADGSDVIRVGGNLKIGSGEIQVAIKGSAGAFLDSYVKIGGNKQGPGKITINGGNGSVGEKIGREGALGTPHFSEWPNEDFSVLKTFANENTDHPANVKGTSSQGMFLRLDGDANAKRHYFELNAADVANASLQLGDNIDPNEPVVISVSGADVVANIQSLWDKNTAQIEMGNPAFSKVASQILWVFPDATDVTITGGQFPGSVVVPNQPSTTTMSAGGTNGRFWVAGDLVQNKGGSEFHNFPFIGDARSGCNQPGDEETPDPTPPAEKVVIPKAPEVEQATCNADGTVTDPKLDLATTEGITYTVDGEIKAGQTVTVTAAAEDGYNLTAAEGWILNQNGTATLKVVLATPDCQTPPVEDKEATPVVPTVEQATCNADGTVTEPTVELHGTEGVSYEIDGNLKTGEIITVIAKAEEGYNLAEVKGWTLHEDGTATFEVVLETPECETVPPAGPKEVTPATPSVEQATCNADGTVTGPDAVISATEGINYTFEGEVGAGENLTVIATPDEGVKLAETKGWTLNEDGTATFQIVFDAPECQTVPPVEDKDAAPVAPEVVQATCNADGTVTDPKLDLATTEGVTYTVDGEVKAGQIVKVTATAKDGYTLTAAEGWTLNEDGTATFEVVLETPECETVPPVEDKEASAILPTVKQATCNADGTVTEPTVELHGSEGVNYEIEGNLKIGEIITIIATADEGYKLTAVDGWTLHEDGTATLDIILDVPRCDTVPPEDPEEVTLATPSVEQATCNDDGTVTGPDAVFSATEGINYTFEGKAGAGETLTVIATPDEGVKLAATEGWTLKEDGTATFQIVFGAPDCETVPPVTNKEVAPVAPVVEQPQCVEGDPVDAKLELPTTEGVAYEVDGEIKAGETVTVIATPTDGFALTEAKGWILNEDGTATFTAAFDEIIDCQPAPQPSGDPQEPVGPNDEDPQPTPDPQEPVGPNTEGSDSLADTGLSTLPFVAAGLGLVIAGFLIVATRRKRS